MLCSAGIYTGRMTSFTYTCLLHRSLSQDDDDEDGSDQDEYLKDGFVVDETEIQKVHNRINRVKSIW
jgi:hypothetical protein